MFLRWFCCSQRRLRRQASRCKRANAADVTLTVVWHGGVCANLLLEIAKDWTQMTGIKVEGALVGYGPQWHDKIASEFAAKGSGFDLACLGQPVDR